MAEAMDLLLFIDTVQKSESSDNQKRLEPTFIPDYRNFAFTKSELHLLLDELLKEGITSKQKKYLERLSNIVAEMIMEYDLSYFKIHGEFPD